MDAKVFGATTLAESIVEAMGLSRRALWTKCNSKTASRARHIAIYLIRIHMEFSYPELARLFKRDPSSVQYAFHHVEKSASLRAEAEALWEQLSRPEGWVSPELHIGDTLTKTGWNEWHAEYRGIVDEQLVLRRRVRSDWVYFLEPASSLDLGIVRLTVDTSTDRRMA